MLVRRDALRRALGHGNESPQEGPSGVLVLVLADQAVDLQAALDDWEPRRGRGAGGDGVLASAARPIARQLRGMAAGAGGAGDREPLLSILDAGLRDGVRELHHLLRTLEIEVAAFAAELGADPLDPVLHAVMDRGRARRRRLADLPALDAPIALTEPSDDGVAQMAAMCRPPDEESDDAPW